MSVSFYIDREPAGYKIGCAFSDTLYETHDDAAAAVEAHGPSGCGDALEWGIRDGDQPGAYLAFGEEHGRYPDECATGVFILPVYTDGAPDELNVSNTNAYGILEALGFARGTHDLVGALPGGELLGRILVAKGLSPEDPGLPSVEYSAEGGAAVIDCGRRPGYLQDVLDRLQDTAEWAAARDLTVRWS